MLWILVTENPTNSCIGLVTRQTGIAPDTPVAFQKDSIFKLMDVMSRMENGAGYLIDEELQYSTPILYT